MAVVTHETESALRGLAQGDLSGIAELARMRDAYQETTGLDARTFALVKIAALISLDAPPASYAWQIAAALDAGVTPDEILGVVLAVVLQVGLPRIVAAAPEIMLALELSLEEGV